MDLQKVNLVKTPCPRGTVIEIEGYGKLTNEASNLLFGIADAYCCFTGRSIIASKDFSQKITVLDLNPEKKSIKVRIAAD